MSYASRPAAGASLMPVHSTDLAAELSGHLTQALQSDLSYAQMNDAKLRGISALVGWDQFHGMVLTAHLAPVNLRADPIDEMAKGISRNKKIEQSKARHAANFAVDQLAQEESKHRDEEQQKRNDAFMKEVDLTPPTNAHEFARDWKRIGANSTDAPDFVRAQRYRYLLSLELSSSSTLLKGGIPLEMIGSIIDATHFAWTAAAAASTAPIDDVAVAAAADTSLPAASSSSAPSPSVVQHISTLLRALSVMSSFTISVFSLTKADKQRTKELLDCIDAAIQTEEFARWQEDRQTPAGAAADTFAAPAAASAVPVAALVTSSPSGAPSSSSSYPMLLSGWPAGVGDSTGPSPAGSAGATGVDSRANQPARDDSSSGNSMTISAATSAPVRKQTRIALLTPAIVQDLRAKYKVL